MALDGERTKVGGPDFLTGGGAMGALMRAHDWTNSSLGDPFGWPTPLRTMVRLMLNTSHPMYIFWGQDGSCLYNDAYRRSIGPERHPASLGQPARLVWTEIWDVIGPQIEQVMSGGAATWHENQSVPITRNGHVEEVFWTYSYSPIDDAAAPQGVGGVLVLCSETTQQVLAERRIEERAVRQRALFEQAPGFICILHGPDHLFEFANKSYQRLVGGRELIGLTVREAFPEISDQSFGELLDRVYRTSERFVATNLSIKLQNAAQEVEEAFLDFVYEPILDEDGQVTGIFVEGQDVTAAHHAHEALRKSEEALREKAEEFEAMAQNIPTLCWMAHADGSIFWYNRRWYEYTGTTAEGQEGWGWESVHDPEILPAVAKRWQKSLDTGEPFDMTFPLKGGDGVFRPFLTRVVPIHNDDGAIERWFGTNVDITELRDAEAALFAAHSAAEAKAAERAAILGQLNEGVIVTDIEGRIIFVNEAATRLHGVAALDVAPDAYSDTYHLFREDGTPYPPSELPLARAVLRGETVAEASWRIRRPDGSEILAVGSAQPIRGVDGEQIGAVLTVRDDTVRHAAERALRDLNDTLEQRVEARTTELTQAQEALRQSQKLEAMGQLTGGVAHDFNNLLTPIVGSLDLLQRKGLGDAREQRLIDGALQSAERARILVQRLLAFARRQPLQASAVDVAGLVGGMAELVASTSGPNIKVEVAVAEQLLPALADPNQLEMAILNLAVNARDAMPDGGRLTIAATNDDIGAGHRSHLAAGRYVHLSVADNGGGMDEATLARAIEPFFSTKGIGKGTGLGLSMAHGLASQLGGALAVSSKVGLGTTIDLWLPVSTDTPGESARAPVPQAGASTLGTVLLVDDEDLVRTSTADMLSELGYAVVEADSAEAALAAIKGGLAVDLLVTDHLMPGMTGADLARMVKEKWPAMSVLIVSGYADADDIAPDFPRLAKPFRQADLAASIAALAD